ncbi:propionate catabolism operon regulatory protein PrpR [Ramlibacter sp.]|uniref:propionate catabolism operon regulatory protein PrpR n=1 Tax=Ramlibacter sp. TaxID=1917967 RepID=UPI0035B03828
MKQIDPAGAASPAAPLRLCFLSYRHLSELALTVMPDFAGRARIEVIEASFDSALAAALAREEAGEVDVFVSAGSNAALLRQAVASPVASVGVNGYDLLLALLRARQLGDRVGVVTFGDTIAELDRVKALLNVDVAQRAYRTVEEARACFRALAAEGCGVIVGSSIVVEMAQQQGLHGILAYSAASVRQALEDAIEMGRVARLEASRHEQVRSVLHNLQEAVLAVDRRHRIIAVNSAMQQLLGPAARVGRDLAAVEPALGLGETLETGEGAQGEVLQFARREWIVNRTPLREGGAVTGAVIALYDAATIQQADSSLRTQRRRRGPAAARHRFDDLVGESPAFRHALDAARRFAPTDLTVLITGESGTGKELVAQAIHQASPRAGRPFIALNCSALPESLLESELFGYEEGAFTGSRRGGRAGLFESAHTGTVFLDEIGDMPPLLQTRLLRVLQEREVTRLGATVPVPVDVRVIAATHQPLEALIARRAFRADLYYRLNLLRVALPPLRERGADLERLALDALHRSLARLQCGLPARDVLARVRSALRAHRWPGNVRELENVAERIALFFAAQADVASAPLARLAVDCPELAPTLGATEAPQAAGLSAVEALARCGGNRAQAASLLGISRATLWRRLQVAVSEGHAVPAAARRRR